MHGADFLAFLKRSRTRAAPTPTNISTNSDPETERKAQSASPATARASRVLPVPAARRGALLGYPRAQVAVAVGVPEEGDQLAHLQLGVVASRDIGEGAEWLVIPDRLAPERSSPTGPPAPWRQ